MKPPQFAHHRLLIACACGVAAGAALFGEGMPLRAITGWNAMALTLLSFAWMTIWRADAPEMRARAALEDPGRSAVWVLATVTSTVSLFAAVVVLREAHSLAPGRAAIWVALCLVAVATSWLLTHTAWALRYAHLYYRDDEEGEGGLVFPGEKSPDAFDFAYFAFTIGICFQTSDVSITAQSIRRATLFHACQSFAYNTAIVALALNLAFGFVTPPG